MCWSVSMVFEYKSQDPRRQRLRASIASVSVSVKSAGWGWQAVFDVRERGRGRVH